MIALYLLKLNNEGDDDDDSYKDCFCGNDESDPSHCVFSLITLITYYIMETTSDHVSFLMTPMMMMIMMTVTKMMMMNQFLDPFSESCL